MNDKDNAMYLVYTEDKDFVLNKEDISGGGSGGSGELPIASADTLGGVKVGSGLSITDSGVLSANGGGGESYHVVDVISTENYHELNISTEELLSLLLSGTIVFTRKISGEDITYSLIIAFTYASESEDYFTFSAEGNYVSEALNAKPSYYEY